MSKRPRGRPPHEDPPIQIATTIPRSLDLAFRKAIEESGEPISQHLAAAIRLYLRQLARRKATPRG